MLGELLQLIDEIIGDFFMKTGCGCGCFILILAVLFYPVIIFIIALISTIFS